MEMTRAQTEVRGVVQDPHREAAQDQVVVEMAVLEDHELLEMVSGLRGFLALRASVQLVDDHRVIAHNAQVIARTAIGLHDHKVTVLTEVAHKAIVRSAQATGLTAIVHLALKVTAPTGVVHKETVRSAQVTALTGVAHKVIVLTGVVHKAIVRSAQATVPMETVHLALKVTAPTEVALKVTVRSAQVTAHTAIGQHDHKATVHMEVALKVTVRSAQVTAHTVIGQHDHKATVHMEVALKVTVRSVRATAPMVTALSVRATALANAPGSKTLLSARCQRVGVGSHVVEPVKWSSTTKMPGSHSMQPLVRRPKVHHSKMCGFALIAATSDEVAARKFKSQRSALVQTSVSCLPMSPLPSARRRNQQLLTDARSSFRT
jgi:hypothetical protein